MPTCAFCPAPVSSGEHLWSEWMDAILPLKDIRFVRRDLEGNIISIFKKPSLNERTNVVCETCNNGWMSDIESNHAKPAMARLILGTGSGITFSQSRANAIALFAFKHAVIIDHMGGDTPFFCRSSRYNFARNGTIPDYVQMWFAGFIRRGTGKIHTDYREATVPQRGRLKLYVCTYSAGHFVFQVVAAKYTRGMTAFHCREGFEHLAVPFWPTIPKKIRWPPQDVLRSDDEFLRFADRWGTAQLLTTLRVLFHKLYKTICNH